MIKSGYCCIETQENICDSCFKSLCHIEDLLHRNINNLKHLLKKMHSSNNQQPDQCQSQNLMNMYRESFNQFLGDSRDALDRFSDDDKLLAELNNELATPNSITPSTSTTDSTSTSSPTSPMSSLNSTPSNPSPSLKPATEYSSTEITPVLLQVNLTNESESISLTTIESASVSIQETQPIVELTNETASTPKAEDVFTNTTTDSVLPQQIIESTNETAVAPKIEDVSTNTTTEQATAEPAISIIEPPNETVSPKLEAAAPTNVEDASIKTTETEPVLNVAPTKTETVSTNITEIPKPIVVTSTATVTSSASVKASNSFIPKTTKSEQPSWISLAQQKSINNNSSLHASAVPVATSTMSCSTAPKISPRSTSPIIVASTSAPTTVNNLISMYTPKMLDPVKPSSQLTTKPVSKSGTTSPIAENPISPPISSTKSAIIQSKPINSVISPKLISSPTTEAEITPKPPVSAKPSSSFLLSKQQFETQHNDNSSKPAASQPKSQSLFMNKTTPSVSVNQSKPATINAVAPSQKLTPDSKSPTNTPVVTSAKPSTSTTNDESKKGTSVLELRKQFVKPIGVSHSFVAANPTNTAPTTTPNTPTPSKAASSFIPQAQTSNESNTKGSKLFHAKQQLESINIVENIKRNIQIKAINPFSSLTPQKQEQLNLRRQQLLQQKDM